ncbi:hypothetical protein, partial [Mycobacterium sp.]|uniref:hypothetical protein n=1 Tax=Mycobacterium sp. TaxID=1785 RepID=UPI0025F00DB7
MISHPAHGVLAAGHRRARQLGHNVLGDRGVQLGARRPAKRRDQRHEEVLGDLFELADAVGDPRRRLTVEIFDRR